MPKDLNQQRLEERIEAWRKSLGTINEDQCAELEDHLRSSLPALIDKGLSIDEAVLLAASRLQGATQSPRKAQTPHAIRHPFLRILLGLLACAIASLGVMTSVLITLYALSYQHITSTGTGISLTIGCSACILMAYFFRKAVLDIRNTTAGTPTTV